MTARAALWMAVGALAWVALLLPPVPGRAAPTTWQGMSFDVPDGWTRKDVRDGVLFQRSIPPAPDGRGGRPGIAIIEVHQPIPASAGTFAATFDRFAGSLPELARERPTLHGAGVTVNNHPIRYEYRCCGTRGDVTIAGDTVGIDAGPSYHVLRLLGLNLRGDAGKQADEEFGALVRSFRPTARDRAFELVPPSGGGGLDGVYTYLSTGLRPNPFGGLDFYSESTITLFDPSGLFSTAIPAGGEDLPAHCRSRPTDCGTYALGGAGLFSGPSRIEMTEVSTRYAILTPRTEPFARDGKDLKVGDRTYRRIDPLPVGTPLEGTWRSFFAVSGSTGLSSNSVSSERILRLARDGRFSRTGSFGFASSTEAGGSRTGAAGAGDRPLDEGRYRVEGYHLVLTGADGRTETLSLFAPDPGSDGLLVINGSNYLKQDQGRPARARQDQSRPVRPADGGRKDPAR